MRDAPRLCMVVHGDFPLDPRVAREARAARAAGWDVDVVALRRVGEQQREIVEGISVTRLPFVHRRGVGVGAMALEYVGFVVAATVLLTLRTLIRRYDVIHIHNPPDFLILAAFVPRLGGARIVFDVHDLSPDMFEMRFQGRRGRHAIDWVLRRWERFATRLADSVITVHEQYRRELCARGVAAEKIEIVMNTVDEDLLPAREPSPPSGFRVVYHGTVTPHYGVALVVEAVAALARDVPDVCLEIYGEGDAVPEIRARAAALDIADQVFVSGTMLEQRDVLAQVAGASVGVVPNLPMQLNRFALSSKLFEYIALGIPVVSADLPTIRAHFGDDAIRYFRAGDASALADALRDVAGDPVATAARVRAARMRYEERYSWAVNSGRYITALARLRDRRLPSLSD